MIHEAYSCSFAQIVPLLSQCQPPLPSNISSSTLETLSTRIQYGGDEVVKAKDGLGSATLSMAYAGAVFTESVIKAISGAKGIIVPSYVNLTADKGGQVVTGEIGKELAYFAVRVELGVSNGARCLSRGKRN